MTARSRSATRAWLDSGDVWIWMNAAAVALSVTALGALLILIISRGLAHFWPADITELVLSADGEVAQVVGQLIESESLSARQYEEATGRQAPFADQPVVRWLIKTGNRRSEPPDFRWIYEQDVASQSTPQELVVLERSEWGNAYGRIAAYQTESDRLTDEALIWPALTAEMARIAGLNEQMENIERREMNPLNYELNQLRLDRRRLVLDSPDPAVAQEAGQQLDRLALALQEDLAASELRLSALRSEIGGALVVLRTASGSLVEVPVVQIVRAWQPNQMSRWGKTSHFLTSFWRFLSEDPREANTEGGVFPAIFGTVLMVLLMSVLVTPLGVIAAIYLMEYAEQGPMVRLIRIAVNNLAGVPSIVYGVFGLGFFVYFIGGNLDRLFFDAALPSPTFGTPGLFWASLTLALLTVPVVIVSTEEGLARIPRSIPGRKPRSRRHPGRNAVPGHSPAGEPIDPDRRHSGGCPGCRRGSPAHAGRRGEVGPIAGHRRKFPLPASGAEVHASGVPYLRRRVSEPERGSGHAAGIRHRFAAGLNHRSAEPHGHTVARSAREPLPWWGVPVISGANAR